MVRGEQHPEAVLDERQADGGCQMALAGAGRADGRARPPTHEAPLTPCRYRL